MYSGLGHGIKYINKLSGLTEWSSMAAKLINNLTSDNVINDFKTIRGGLPNVAGYKSGLLSPYRDTITATKRVLSKGMSPKELSNLGLVAKGAKAVTTIPAAMYATDKIFNAGQDTDSDSDTGYNSQY